MNENIYINFMDNIKTPKSALDKAVEVMQNSAVQPQITEFKPKRKGFRSIAVTAAVLCLVMLAGVFFYPFGSKGENIFAINVGAAAVNTYEFAKLGELKCESNSLGLMFNEDNEVTTIAVGENLSFPITCTGQGIKEVTYIFNGIGFFLLPEDASFVCGKEVLKEADELLLYSRAGAEYEYSTSYSKNRVSSFTLQKPEVSRDVLLCLYAFDKDGPYCKMYNEGYIVEGDAVAHGKNMDYKQMYYELYNSENYSVDVAVTFEDGTTQTKTIELVIEKADNQSYAENHSTLIVSAKLAE